jgi:DNA-binding transcriptional regulator YiaG
VEIRYRAQAVRDGNQLMSPAALRTLIASTGMSVQLFAVDVLARDSRTVRRWLSGETVIPDAAAQWLERLDSVRAQRVEIVIRLRT